MRLMFVIRIASELSVSAMKSRFATASILFSIGFANPRYAAVRFLSIAKPVPAKAADPRGEMLTRV